ncbi:MAG: mevalonate kinase [Candidatus Marsarchaeota archaeon]|nr:mevalonate kinase [Candidatus Marsarchaeota archaeon]
MANILSRAPGVLKLFGEHAVVYGKKCAAITINRFAIAKIQKYKKDLIAIYLKDKNQTIILNKKLIEKIRDNYNKNFNNINNFDFKNLLIYKKYIDPKLVKQIETNKDLLQQIFAYGLISAKLLENNINIFGKKVEISSDIPEKKGLASSAACFIAFTISLISMAGKKLKDSEITEIARHGEIIAHKNKNAGKIDIAASYFGGIISYKNSKIRSYNINNIKNLDLVIIDTGPKKSTAETVLHVSRLYNKNKARTGKILNQIELCCNRGLGYLKKNNIIEFGKQIYKNHELLNKLGVSTNKLNKAILLSKLNKAYGAKLSGGGGGGIAIAFIDKNKSSHLIDIMKKNNFNAFKSEITEVGARHFIKK